MALEGNLRDFNLLEVIQLLGQQGKSGVLRIWDKGGVDTQIFLCEGKVTHATTTKKGTDLLGERLAKTGIISRTDFEEALRAQKESARYLGEILVESGMADEVAVLNALFTQIHEVIYGIFRQGEGKFQFETLPVSQFPKIAVNLSAEEVMFNILRMVDVWPEIERKVPAPYIVLKHTGTLEGQGIELPEDHDGVYRLVDGDRTVEDISELSLLGKFATLEILADLLEGGYLTVVESKRAPSEPQLRQTVESLKRQSHRAAYAWAFSWSEGRILRIQRSWWTPGY